MKEIIKFLVLGLIATVFYSCEKDNITNTYFEEHPGRMDKIAEELKSTLASAPEGWVMMVKTGLNSQVYTPVVLKFDTLKNRVFVKTVYGETADTESYFRIANGTGAPQLIFTTGSIMSTLYRVGAQASDITDHIYNVVSVSADTVAIRGYRSGAVYKPEGGVVYKMFKRPKDWKWADDEIYFDMSSASFRTNVEGVRAKMEIEYVKNSGEKKSFETEFNTVPDMYMVNMQSVFPFSTRQNIGTGGFKTPYYFFMEFPYAGDIYDVSPVVANNTISFYPQYGYTTNLTYMNYFINAYNLHYLVCKDVVRTGNNVKMDFEAYDKQGNVIVKATYNNLR